MKRLVILAGCALASCSQPAAPGATAAAKPANVVQFTEADLTQAIAMAQAAPSTNLSAPFIVSCFTFLKSQLAALPSAAPGVTNATGVATAFVTADLALGTISTAISPNNTALFAFNCGPLQTYIANQALALPAQVAALGAVLAIKP